ncbi:G-box binding factor 3, putative isoform 2 [Hibiscus syriacus]|uniref:G-box binding factor 3, putative isoform 2 n=1 Tax=Hibiscus syriacus TaxID=106335 RepID=A0A6A2YZS5_HIBSY|nr:G-box binding factor 3, putative isoform 2 [Hibiscus syriacus]
MMPPYGAPYATIYPHAGVYARPAVPLTSTAVETPTKSSGNTEWGLTKKMKGFDGLAMSIGNGTAENDEGAAEPRMSQSAETEGSTDGSDGNTTGVRSPSHLTDQSRRKRSREGTPTVGGDGKNEAKAAVEVTTTISPGMSTALELRNPPSMIAKSSPTNVPCGVMPPGVWMQNERELKRERRKQSNRESARRSRLRKQEGLKAAQLGQVQEIPTNNNDDKEGEMYEKKSGAKLHQLLDASPRTDAVAAS